VVSRKTRQVDLVDQPWLHRVVGILQQPVAVLDGSHRILAASKPFYHLVGATPQSAFGRNLCEVGGGILDAPVLQRFLDSIEPASTKTDRNRIETGKGFGRTFVLRAQRIPAKLSSGKMVVAIEETTQSTLEQVSTHPPRHADQQDQQTSSITEAHHDLRQPLQTLSLLQGVLAAREKDPELHQLVERLEEAIGALTGMLNAVVSVDRLSTGLISPIVRGFHIDLVIDRLRTEMAYHADARGLEWHVVPCKVAVRSDSYLLGQVLRALLMDAMKLIKRGKVLFGCRRRGSQLLIQIWIRGAGVSADQQEIILSEYHRRDEPSRETTLVEMLVRPLSDRLGLVVKARSRPGNGLVFSVEMPIESQLSEAAIRGYGTHHGTILVVSDDPSGRDALVLLLREVGHEILTTTPHDGFATLIPNKNGSVRPEVVIVDLKGAIERSKKVVSSLRWMLGWEIPAIVLGGNLSKEGGTDAIGEPCIYLPKPVRPSELPPQIARLLSLVRHRAAASRPPNPDALQHTVFVIDDDRVLRDAVRDILGLQGQNVELFSSGESFLDVYKRDRRGCLVIDNKLPGIAGVEVLERLKSDGSTLPSIMITGHGDISTAVRAMKAGAIDYIEKPISYDTFLAAIDRALEIDRGSADALARRRELAARVAELTPRERQVMDLVVAGQSSKSIAQILKISQRTVENHRAAIMKRAGAASLSDLIRIVMQLQLSEDHWGRRQ
jgi:two-component system CheB/CheR fusion protein